MKIVGKKFIEILITAGVAALIAFLQSFLVGLGDISLPAADPAVAGGVGAAIRGGLSMLPHKV